MPEPSTLQSLNRIPPAQLWHYQQQQGQSNNCALHSLAAMLNLHYGMNLEGSTLARRIDSSWWRHPLRYRMAPGWATHPLQAQRVLAWLSRELGFQFSCRLLRTQSAYLLDLLRFQRNTYALITILWWGSGPQMLTRQQGKNIFMHTNSRMGGHTMLLAAYDPERVDDEGIHYPWGFINSWATPYTQDLFWMDQETWQRMIKLRTLVARLS